MKKRLFSIFAAALLLMPLLSGCGREEPAEPEPTETPAPAVTADPHAGMVEVSNGAGGTVWVDEAEGLPLFPLDRTLFSVTDGAVSYAGEGCELRRGVDVSEHQGDIDWLAVKSAGIDFAILRCGWRGYGGGSLNEDTYFRRNLEGAHAAGLEVGVYFFSQAVSVMEAAEEAVYTARLLEGCTLELPVYFDWEIIGTEPARTDDTDAHTVTQAALEFCSLMESSGYRAGIYSYIPNVYTMYELDSLAGMEFWMGDPGTWPEFRYDHAVWQYSFTGNVPGISGDVDMNVMYILTGTPDTGEGAVG